jgi:predicted RNA-binding Zn-ribbon protein involved in translation (DUF1610 family)
MAMRTVKMNNNGELRTVTDTQARLYAEINIAKDTIEESCPHCENTVLLEDSFTVQLCPSCGAIIKPCGICEIALNHPIDCGDKTCPLEKYMPKKKLRVK